MFKKVIATLFLILSLSALAHADAPKVISDFDRGIVMPVKCGSGTGYRLNEGSDLVITPSGRYLTAEAKCGNISIPQRIYAFIFQTSLGKWREQRVKDLNSL